MKMRAISRGQDKKPVVNNYLKTRTIIARASYMIEDGVNPRSMLIFTFTKKAANELKERINSEIGEIGSLITTGTYHSFCCRVLRRSIEKLGVWTKNFSIFDDDDSRRILKGIQEEFYEKEGNITPHAMGYISDCKERMISANVAVQTAGGNKRMKMFADIYKRYADELIRQNALDFDDLIYVTIRLLESHPEVKEAINNCYKYIIADEAQDSSPRDLELIEHLMGNNKNVCLVGDDYQSIYGFRGSDIDAFFNFVEKYNLKKFYLSQNYRSTKTIVNAAQSVIDRNPKQFEKHLFSENENGVPIIYYCAKSINQEAQRVTAIVKALIAKGEVQSYEDVAVLYRTNAQSRRIEESFLSNGIPYHMLSGVPFYCRMEIKDLMSYCRLLFNPNDRIAFERAIQTPPRGIGSKTLETLNSCIYDDSNDIMSIEQLIEALKSCKVKRATKGLMNFVSILETLNVEKDTTAPRMLINTLLTVSKYFEHLKKVEEPEDYERRVENVMELMELADGYNSLEALVNDFAVNESKTELAKDEKKEGVKLLTIHGSKGLEFKVVILIGCNEGTLPFFKALQEGTVEEERRLFYVGLTRAKEKIFLIRAFETSTYGPPRYQEESRFLDEIDEEYIKRRG